jgi:hypothetical protein
MYTILEGAIGNFASTKNISCGADFKIVVRKITY